jgi:hypothetical protein
LSGSVDLTLKTGADWAYQISWLDSNNDPIPFTNPTMDIRQELNPQGSVIARFDTSGDLDGLISFPAPGTMLLTMDKEVTNNLPTGYAHWDLFVTVYSSRVKLVYGTIAIEAHVTALA